MIVVVLFIYIVKIRLTTSRYKTSFSSTGGEVVQNNYTENIWHHLVIYAYLLTVLH